MADMSSSPEAEVQELIIRSRRLVTRSERVKRWGIIYCAALLTVAIGILLWMARSAYDTGNRVESVVTAIRQQQVANVPIAHNTNITVKQVRAIFAQFEDCIKPDGTCYRQGQHRTANALVTLELRDLAQTTCSSLSNLPTAPMARFHAVAHCASNLLNQPPQKGKR